MNMEEKVDLVLETANWLEKQAENKRKQLKRFRGCGNNKAAKKIEKQIALLYNRLKLEEDNLEQLEKEYREVYAKKKNRF